MKQDLLKEQREILRHFHQLATKYAQLVAKTYSTYQERKKDSQDSHERALQQIKGKLQRDEEIFDRKLNNISGEISKATNDLNRHYSRVVGTTSASDTPLYVGNDNPGKVLEQCVDHAARLRSEIEKISGKPINWGCVIGFVSIVVWVLSLFFVLGSMKGSMGDAFWTAITLTFLIIAGVIYFPNKRRRTPYAQLLRLKLDAIHLHKLILEKLKKEYNGQINLSKEKYTAQLNVIESDCQSALNTAKQNFEENMSKLHQSLEQFRRRIDQLSPEWTDEY